MKDRGWMGKIPHRDVGVGFAAADFHDVVERLGVRWPELPWTCPECGTTFERHTETIAVIDMELLEGIFTILTSAPPVLAIPRLETAMPMFARNLRKFYEELRDEWRAKGPPAEFLCMRCDLIESTLHSRCIGNTNGDPTARLNTTRKV